MHQPFAAVQVVAHPSRLLSNERGSSFLFPSFPSTACFRRVTKSHQTVATAKRGRTACVGNAGDLPRCCCALINLAARSRAKRHRRVHRAQTFPLRVPRVNSAKPMPYQELQGSVSVPERRYLPLTLLGSLLLGAPQRTFLPVLLPYF